MNPAERNALMATAGLVLAAIGTFLPWARIGGRNRSGFNTADTFIALAEGALPDAVAWVGRWWYLPALLSVIAWATTFLRSSRTTRAVGVSLILISLAMWWLFVWAGRNYNVLDTKLLGPLVATVGLLTVGYCCTRRRTSIVASV